MKEKAKVEETQPCDLRQDVAENTEVERIVDTMEEVRKAIKREKGIMLFAAIVNGKIVMSTHKEGAHDMTILLSQAAGGSNDIAKAVVSVASVNYPLATEVLTDFLKVHETKIGKGGGQ